MSPSMRSLLLAGIIFLPRITTWAGDWWNTDWRYRRDTCPGDPFVSLQRSYEYLRGLAADDAPPRVLAPHCPL
jgi:hypothetical protein